ncbi:hypothetical protein V6N11_002081 [Hibiscus sabdariffa]|uniref:Uncharacterized protein n=1 Tax=Hibiscus sabdariffa TaxID=183260 RepID=A0ABR2QU73_9ROSI
MSENPLPESKSESFSSSNINRSKSPTEVTGQHSQSGEDELNAAIIGNNRNFGKGGFDMGKGRSLGECELMGEKLEKMATRNEIEPEKDKWEVGVDKVEREEPNEIEKNREVPEILSPNLPKNLGSSPILPLSENQNSIFKKAVENPQLEDEHFLEGEHGVEKGEDEISSTYSEENFSNAERVFFPELESKRERRKRYGSMIQIQDKAISEKEKKEER